MGADRVTQGPIGATNPSDQQAIILDAQNGILEVSGNNRKVNACQTCLLVLAAQVALSNVTTAQNLLAAALNAGVLNKLGRVITITGSLIYTTPGTTTPTMTIAVTFGGVTLCTITTAALSATASTNMPVQFAFTIETASLGATGTIEAHGSIVANISANTPAAAANSYLDTNTAVSSAVNLTASGTLAVTVAASSAITSVQLRLATVEVEN